MHNRTRWPIVASIALAAATSSTSSAQDPVCSGESELLHIGSGVTYFHRTTDDAVARDETVNGLVHVGSNLFNRTSETVVTPQLDLVPAYEIIYSSPTPDSVNGVYHWSFPDVPPAGPGPWVDVELNPEGEGGTGDVPFQPGFDFARSMSPSGLDYPGGTMTATVSLTLAEETLNGRPINSFSIQVWAPVRWLHPDFNAQVISYDAHPDLDCHQGGTFYAYCYLSTGHEPPPRAEVTYDINVVFDVSINEGVQHVEWMPYALAQVGDEGGTFGFIFSDRATLQDEYGAWTWTTQVSYCLYIRQWRGRAVEFQQIASSSRAIEVTIDIKPGSAPNSIKLGSNGNVPVAILSSPGFDALSVDPLSVELGGAAVRIRGKGAPMSSIYDVNNDGLNDLVVHVDTQALDLTEGEAEVVLTGETFSGQFIEGRDSVRIVP